jgi:hypothetical protein
MVIVCPTCRAPSNTRQAQCWVCKRAFDGTEPRIGGVPHTRRPAQFTELFVEPDDEFVEFTERRVAASFGRYR